MAEIVIVEFKVISLFEKDGLITDRKVACSVSGKYDLAKDAVIRQTIDRLKKEAICPKPKNPSEKS